MSTVKNNLFHGSTHQNNVATREPIRVAILIGQSNALGTDSTGNPSDSQNIQSYHDSIALGLTPTYREQGVTLTTYPVSTGPASLMFEKMRADGVSDPYIINRAIGGANEITVREHATGMGAIYSDLTVLGLTPEDVNLVWLIHGEADSANVTLANKYRSVALERIARICEVDFPNALFCMAMLADTANQYLTVRTAQAECVARRANRFLVDTSDFQPTYLVGGGFHWTYDGQVLAVDRLWDEIGPV